MRGRGRYPLRLAPPENCCDVSNPSPTKGRQRLAASLLITRTDRLARACSSRSKTLRPFSRVAARKFLTRVNEFPPAASDSRRRGPGRTLLEKNEVDDGFR